MKRMELKSALTFAIIFIVGVIVNGIISAVSEQANFFTFGVMAKGLSVALLYAGCILIRTSRHKLLPFIGAFGALLMVLFVVFSCKEIADKFVGMSSWRVIVDIILYMISSQIANRQGKELLEEDKEP